MKYILLADDDADMRGMIARWLAREYRVTEAASGEEALSLLAKERPDLLLLDYVMPGMSGPDTLRALRAQNGGDAIAAAFLTGEDALDITSAELAPLHPLAAWSKSLGKRSLLAALAQYFNSQEHLRTS